ncbi:MAG TPA: site-specific integrase, partial [Vicinamibacteria bacterium]|nr:site-specific integrase [Vicinamibacteria bacterium]
MEQAVAAFLRSLEFERNASPHTRRAYGQDLQQFTEHLREELGRAPRPEDVDHLMIRAFLARLHRAGLKKSSAARKLASLRTFFRYLCREGRLEKNPARALLAPRTEKRIPGRLEEADVGALLDVPGRGLVPARARAILELLYGTGIRCAELVGLDLGDVDLGARMVRVLGKGRKERVVPFGSRAAEALGAYLVERTA